jgi:hypothetical protein
MCTWSGIRCSSGTCTPMSRGLADYDPVTLRSALAVPPRGSHDFVTLLPKL